MVNGGEGFLLYAQRETKMKRHLIGTHIQDTNGRVRVKIGPSDWVARGRLNWMRFHREEIMPNERIFHINGDRANDNKENLIKIRFTGTRYFLRHSKILFRPKEVPKARDFKPQLARVA